MSEDRGAEFYRGRAEDMRRQAGRAITPPLRDTYLHIADEWQRMAEQAQATNAEAGTSRPFDPGR